MEESRSPDIQYPQVYDVNDGFLGEDGCQLELVRMREMFPKYQAVVPKVERADSQQELIQAIADAAEKHIELHYWNEGSTETKTEQEMLAEVGGRGVLGGGKVGRGFGQEQDKICGTEEEGVCAQMRATILHVGGGVVSHTRCSGEIAAREPQEDYTSSRNKLFTSSRNKNLLSYDSFRCAPFYSKVK